MAADRDTEEYRNVAAADRDTEGFKIVMAADRDREELLSLYRSQIGREGCPWTLEYPSEETIDFDLSRDALYVLKAEGKIVGAVSIEEDEEVNRLPFWNKKLEPEAEFARIAVRPDMQGKGIGKIMLRFLFDEFKKRNFHGVHIIVNRYNSRALRLYDSFNFKNVGECHMYNQDFYCYEMELNKDKENLFWEEVRTTHIIQNEWIDFREHAYRFPDGNVYEPFYTYSRRDYAVVVAFDADGNYICVRQFRQGIRQVTTEFPAGGLERSDGKDYRGNDDDLCEDALEAAKRELLEETGYVSEEWKHLITIPSNATISDNNAYVYVALNCHRVKDQDLDDMEFLNVEILSPEALENLVHTGGFQQSVHVMAWLLAVKQYGIPKQP